MTKYIKTAIALLAVAALLVGLVSSCDYLNAPGQVTEDPNRATTVSADLLFTSVQVNTYFIQTGNMARMACMWIQQMQGTSRQYLGFGRYEVQDGDLDGEMNSHYQGGGLIDIRNMYDYCDAAGWVGYKGIAQVYEVMLFATAASCWGDLPYSQAVGDNDTPTLDDQEDIYDALHLVIDDAIDNLEAGTGYLPPNDLSFEADLDAWIEVAYTLKARMYMHWAEVYPGNYALALTAAQSGISAAGGDWMAMFGDQETESNTWYQFWRERDDYIRAGAYLVDLLTTRSDPRLTIYFGEDESGGYSGSAPGEGATGASNLSTEFLDRGHDYDLISYEENQFIIAECQFDAGNEALAITAVNNALAAAEIKYGLADGAITRLPTDGSLTGTPLFEQIMEEKYICLFLNIEVWNDWKRTDLPVLTPYTGCQIPRAFYYSDDERNTNPNIPDQSATAWELRNDNDPS
jgi:hypothetical protein